MVVLLRFRFGFVSLNITQQTAREFPLLFTLTYFPPDLRPPLPPYQDVLEAEVIVMTQCWTLRIGSEQAAAVPFPRALWRRETG